MRIRIWNLGSGALLTPGAGMVKKPGSGSGMNNLDHIYESLETIFGLKYLNSLMRIRDPGWKIRIRDSGWKKFGSATLRYTIKTFNFFQLSHRLDYRMFKISACLRPTGSQLYMLHPLCSSVWPVHIRPPGTISGPLLHRRTRRSHGSRRRQDRRRPGRASE